MVKKRAKESIIGLHHCDSHTAVTCFWRDFAAPPSTTKNGKNNWSWNQSLTKLIRHPLSQPGTLFTKAYTHANQRHTVHTIYTHRNTLIHTDTRVVREITVL